MITIVDVTKPQTINIGYVGENNITTLKFIMPESYSNGYIYLDWDLPNGLITQTEKIINNVFTIPNEFLTKEGTGKFNVIYKTADGIKKVITEIHFRILNAINADSTVIITYTDVIQDLQNRMESWESAASSADSAKISEDNSKASELAAKVSEEAAKISETNSKTSENNTKISEANAKTSETNSKTSETTSSQALSDLLNIIGTQIATLDANGKLTAGQIPPIAINDTFPVSGTTAMLALAAQRGDVALIVVDSVVTDSYILTTDDPTTLSNWSKLGVSYVAESGHAINADTANNSNMINNHRIVEFESQAEFDSAVKVEGTYYFVKDV